MFKPARSVALAVAVLATAIGFTALTAGASSASATAARPFVHAAVAVPDASGKFINHVRSANTPMRSGPGVNLPMVGTVVSTSLGISDYCFQPGLSGAAFWDVVFDAAIDRTGFIQESQLTNTSQILPC